MQSKLINKKMEKSEEILLEIFGETMSVLKCEVDFQGFFLSTLVMPGTDGWYDKKKPETLLK